MLEKTETLYDTKILVQTHHADTEFIKYMISLFIKLIPETNAALIKACKEKDWNEVYLSAHKMKASIDLFELKELKELIRKTEQKAKNKVETETIAADIKFISAYLQKCIAAMKEDFNLE